MMVDWLSESSFSFYPFKISKYLNEFMTGVELVFLFSLEFFSKKKFCKIFFAKPLNSIEMIHGNVSVSTNSPIQSKLYRILELRKKIL